MLEAKVLPESIAFEKKSKQQQMDAIVERDALAFISVIQFVSAAA